MGHAKNILIAALACLLFSACAEADELPDETEQPIYYTTAPAETTAAQTIDYSDRYTPLYTDYFLKYTENKNRCSSDDIKQAAESQGYTYTQGDRLQTNSGGYVGAVYDDLGNRAIYLFNDSGYMLMASYDYDNHTGITCDHRKRNYFYVSESEKEYIFDTLNAAETKFFELVPEPLTAHDSTYGVSVATAPRDNDAYITLMHGDRLSAIEVDDGKTLIVKAKIKPSFSNTATIDQNYYNIEDLILNQGCDKYDEIQYWAVADMSDGTESKVVSFTVSKAVIDAVKNQTVVAITMGDYVSDLYIHSCLRE